jgi:Fic family protein
MRQEALSSSRIEGTRATPEDIALLDVDATPKTEDAREVGNFIDATSYALDQIREGMPLTGRLLLAVHQRLMSGVWGDRERPGQYRDAQNFIAAPSGRIGDARFVPPPHTALPDLLRDFEQLINDAQPELPPLVRAGIAHYQFETIHPFRDGNGRIGRLIVSLLLIRDGLLPGPLLPLSVALEKRRTAYTDYLLRVSTHGDWTAWIDFFLGGIIESATDAIAQVDAVIQLRARWHASVQTARSSALLVKLIDHIFQQPAITIRGAADIMGVTVPAAERNVAKLVNAGIVKEATGQARNRIFVAPDVLRFYGEP